MQTGADQRLYTIDPSQAECQTPLIIDSPAECTDCNTQPAVQLDNISIHNLLNGLQGGQSGQYYHLTLTQYQAVLAANDPSSNNAFATLADLTNNTYNFSSGLTSDDDRNVTLGGALTQDTIIDNSEGYNFTISADAADFNYSFTPTYNQNWSHLNKDSNVTTSVSPDDGLYSSETNNNSSAGINVSSSQNPSSHVWGSGAGLNVFNSDNEEAGIFFNTTQLFGLGGVVIDYIDQFGLQYLTDYSANGKQNDNWIPSWGAVKTISPGLPVNGVTNISDTTFGLGGSLTNDTTISMSGHPIYFTNDNIGTNANLNTAGITIQNTTTATGPQTQNSPPLVFLANSYDSSTSTSYQSKWAIQAHTNSGDGPVSQPLIISSSIDGGSTWTNILTMDYEGDVTARASIGAPRVGGNIVTASSTFAGPHAHLADGGPSDGVFDGPVVLELRSQTRGFLLPRMISSVRDNIMGVGGAGANSVNITNGGSGYTSPPTVVFSGGGTPSATAAATAYISGGSVVRVEIEFNGIGYTSVPTVSFTGGGGTGATATVSSAITGLIIYNTATDRINVFSGSSQAWEEVAYTTDSSAGVSSFNTRTGDVVFNGTDLAGALEDASGITTSSGLFTIGNNTQLDIQDPTGWGGITIQNYDGAPYASIFGASADHTISSTVNTIGGILDLSATARSGAFHDIKLGAQNYIGISNDSGYGMRYQGPTDVTNIGSDIYDIPYVGYIQQNFATISYVDSAVAGVTVPVTSVFGRTGAIVAATNDYTFSQIGSKPTTLSGYGITDAYPLTGNPSGFLTGITSGQVTTALGYTPYDAANPNGYLNAAGMLLNTAGAVANAITFNNSGSGASSGATYNGSAAPTISYNTIGAQAALTGTGFVKVSGGTVSYDVTVYAPLASPALTGGPTAPTQGPLDNSTRIATTAYVDAAVSAGSGSGGTVTSIIAGSGLTGGTITSTGTVAIDYTQAPTWTGAHAWQNNSASSALVPYVTLANNTTGLSSSGSAKYSPSLSWLAPVYDGGSTTGEVRAYVRTNKYDGDVEFILSSYEGGTYAQDIFNVDGFGNGFTTGSWGVHFNSVGTSTTSDGLVALNFTAATSGARVQNSPITRLMGGVWNTSTSANNWTEWTQGVRNTSGATPVSQYYWSERTSTNNSGAYTDLMSLNNSGLLTVTGSVTSAGLTVNGLALFTGTLYTDGTGGSATSNLTTIGGTTQNNHDGGRAGTTVQAAGSSTMFTRVMINGQGAGQTLSTNSAATGLIVGSMPFFKASSGTHPLLASAVFNPIGTISGGAATVGITSTVYINGPGTGGTTNYALSVASGISHISALEVGYVAKTSSYTLTANDNLVAASGASNTQTLPTAVGCSGRVYTVKNVDASANTITVATTSSQTIDGSTTYSLAARYKYVTVMSDGANWMIVAGN